MAVIVITGAAGVIGRAVSPQLAARHQLRLVDVEIPEHADGTWTRGSIADPETLAPVTWLAAEAAATVGGTP